MVFGVFQSSFFLDYMLGIFIVFFQNILLDVFFFEWDFGDGFLVNMDFYFIYIYDIIGIYIVILIVINECGSDIVIQEVVIVLLFVVGFFILQDIVCVFFMVQVVNNVEGIVENWFWIVNGVNLDIVMVFNFFFIFDVLGIYDIVLQVFNVVGSSFDIVIIVIGGLFSSVFILIDIFGFL